MIMYYPVNLSYQLQLSSQLVYQIAENFPSISVTVPDAEDIHPTENRIHVKTTNI